MPEDSIFKMLLSALIKIENKLAKQLRTVCVSWYLVTDLELV